MSTMRNYLLLSFCALALLFSGCSETTTEPQKAEELQKQNYIVPLNVGNQWRYKGTSVYNGLAIEEIYDMTVQSEETINGIKEYSLLKSSEIAVSRHWYNTPEGFWHNYIKIDSKKFMAKYPCESGDKWVLFTFTRTDNKGNVLGEAEVRMTVISTNIQRTVNGKNYTCYHYRESINDVKTGEIVESAIRDYYYAVNIGLVQEIYAFNNIEDYRIELLSHTLK